MRRAPFVYEGGGLRLVIRETSGGLEVTVSLGPFERVIAIASRDVSRLKAWLANE